MAEIPVARKYPLGLILLMLGLSLIAVACDQPGPTPDAGPNAQLSNAELLQKAVANMKALRSYRFQFNGGAPSQSVQMSPSLSMTGEIQLNGKGSRITMKDGAGPVEGSPQLMLGIGQSVEVRQTKDAWYETYDGGQTWDRPPTDTPAGFLLSMFDQWWESASQTGAKGEKPLTHAEQMLHGLTFTDGNPRVEAVDGVTTRHMVAQFPAGNQAPDPLSAYADWGEGWHQSAQAISLWVSTDISPTVRQMQITGHSSVPHNHVGSANALTFSPDGQTLAVAHGDAQDWTIRLWDLHNLRSPPKKPKGASDRFSSVAFSPDGKYLAAGTETGGPPGQVLIWELSNPNAGSPAVTLPLAGSPKAVAFRPDGQMLAAATARGIALWRPPYTGAKPTILPGSTTESVYSVAFSPDNHSLAAGVSDAGVYIYDTEHPETAPRILPGHTANAVAFSPDGRLLAALSTSFGDRTNPVNLWDLRQANPTPTVLPGDEVSGETVAFSPDGRLLAASGQDDHVRLWDLARLPAAGSTPTPALVLAGGRLVYSVAFSPNGKQLAAASSDGAVRLWDIGTLWNGNAPAPPGSAASAAATPTIIREDEQVTSTVYTLTWKWGRFNEDFGEVTAPPTETIKSP